VLSNDAAGACTRDVNSAVVGSPDRPGATPPRTLSDYFTADSPLARLSDSSVLRAPRVYERARVVVLRAYSKSRGTARAQGTAIPHPNKSRAAHLRELSLLRCSV